MRIFFRCVASLIIDCIVIKFKIQCSIPVFEGLLPKPYDRTVEKLLFTMAHWHGLAKLRLHTDSTLKLLDDLTTSLGSQLRHFANVVCPAFQTEALPKEIRISDKKGRNQTPKSKSDMTISSRAISKSKAKTPKPPMPKKSNQKLFNLKTYKVHALGDYVEHIRLFGTTDSYSTEPVSDGDAIFQP